MLFDFDEYTNESKLIQDVYNNLKFLKSLSVREYLIYKKFKELMNLGIHNIYKLEKIYNLNIPTTIDETIEVYNNIKKYKSIVLERIDKNNISLFTKLLMGTTLMEIVPNPGRSIRYIVKEQITNKVIGFLIIGSDVISIGVRDRYIGWDKECKLKKGKLQNIAIARIIVPVQPFGYLLNGGKLIALLLNHDTIRRDWRESYNQELVGVTTTSLFGRPSMYDGLDKYIKNLGDTKGEILINPDNDFMNKIHFLMKNKYSDEYNKVIKKTGPKQQVLNLFFKKYIEEFRKLDTSFKIKNLKHGFVRGVYFIPFYEIEHVKEYLNCKIDKVDENRLMFKTNNDIIDYWIKKFADKRFQKIINDIDYNDDYFSSLYTKIIKSQFKYEKFLKLNL